MLIELEDDTNSTNFLVVNLFDRNVKIFFFDKIELKCCFEMSFYFLSNIIVF